MKFLEKYDSFENSDEKLKSSLRKNTLLIGLMNNLVN